ncbi:acylphosphatase [Clostridium ljungdahlii]|uniref:acylphosphatase n=1 Tax=Clostridium ljungdahlii TaxID=1538 RepID=UPI003866E10A
MKDYKTLSIRVYGIVQGVGFRPTVSRHADKNHIRGSVCNKGPYVEIWAQGSESELEGFLYDLEHNPPKRSSILKIDVHKEEESEKFQDFEIIESEHVQGEIFVSPDIAICPECKRELFDKNNRRYLHPFINCTCCGPRLTILDSMPYDRVRTSMGEFPMCPECEYEYTHAETRRYDAQPVCCNECGPEVYLIGRGERAGLQLLIQDK